MEAVGCCCSVLVKSLVALLAAVLIVAWKVLCAVVAFWSGRRGSRDPGCGSSLAEEVAVADPSAAAALAVGRVLACGVNGSSASGLDISIASAAAAPPATRVLAGGDNDSSGSESGISMILTFFLPSEEAIVAPCAMFDIKMVVGGAVLREYKYVFSTHWYIYIYASQAKRE